MRKTEVQRPRGFPSRPTRDGNLSRKTLTKSEWWPQRDSNPCLSLERASPWVVISPTSTPGATARCHSRRGIVPRIHLLFVDLSRSTKSRAIPKSRFVRSAAAYPQRHAEGPVGQSWSRAGLTTLGCCDGDPSRNPSADRRFAEAFCFVPLAGVGWLCVEPDAQRPRI